MKTLICPHCGSEIEKDTLCMDTEIGDICLSVRVYRTLWRANIHTMADLHDFIQKNGVEGLRQIHGIGSYTRNIIGGFYESFLKILAEKRKKVRRRYEQ